MATNPDGTGTFDFIVVGGGSAGCVVAARLSECGRYQVALVEAGKDDRTFWARVPLGSGKLIDDPAYTWRYDIEPDPNRGSLGKEQVRGKMLGGSSSINGMIYTRGQRQDFDLWSKLGNEGWSFDEVLPYFIKSEDNVRGASKYHGVGGPLCVSDVPHHPMLDAFLASAGALGFPMNSDFNAEDQEGFGYVQLNTRKGVRESTSTAFLRGAAKRPNLTVITNACASRICVEDGIATGVEIKRNGQVSVLSARREIVLACGAINSPQLLQLSGIGPAGLLNELNLPVVSDLPGVGENLQDHYAISFRYRCAKPLTLNDIVNSPIRRTLMGMQYILFRKGLMATNGNMCSGFLRSNSQLKAPDVRILMCLWNRENADKNAKGTLGLDPVSSFNVVLNLLHPDCSGGSVRIRNAQIDSAPEIRFGFPFAEMDQQAALFGMRIIRSLMSTEPMNKYVAEELQPGVAASSDEDLIAFARATGGSVYHSVGTCKMGSDTMAVVDARLRVHGVKGLRVVDASIMPTLVGGNTAAATVMIGEKGAAMLLEDAG